MVDGNLDTSLSGKRENKYQKFEASVSVLKEHFIITYLVMNDLESYFNCLIDVINDYLNLLRSF